MAARQKTHLSITEYLRQERLAEVKSEYQLLPSLQEYLLVTQDYCRLEHYQRQDDQQWVYSEFHALEDEVNLHTLGCVLKVADVYRKVGLA